MTGETVTCPGCGKEYVGGLHRVFGLVDLCTQCISECWVACWRKTGFHSPRQVPEMPRAQSYRCDFCRMYHHTMSVNTPGPALARHRERLRTVLISAGCTRNGVAFRAEDVHPRLMEIVIRARPNRTVPVVDLNRRIAAGLGPPPAGRPPRHRRGGR